MAKNQIALACETVAGFTDLISQFTVKLTINGLSNKTIEAYTRTVAQIGLYFACSPFDLDEPRLERYLFELRKTRKGPTAFKLAIYALRSLYDCFGHERLKTSLPSISQPSRLPVVLAQADCRKLIMAPKRLRDRFLIAFMYSTGMRICEVLNLRICDVDRERMQVYVRQSKYNKDRYLPLSSYIAATLDKYFEQCKPIEFFFNSTRFGRRFSIRGLQRVIRAASLDAHCSKPVSAHMLRHSYATHLLESGVDLLTIKNLLGHENIATTMLYLHVAKCKPASFRNPLDILFNR